MTKAATLLLAALLALSAGCVLSASGELPDVEVTRHGVAVPGVPLEARVGDPVVSVPVSFDPRDQISLDGKTYHSVRVRGVVFKSNAAGGDLSFVRDLRMTISGVSGTAIQILHYQRDEAAPPVGATLEIPVDPPVEVLPAWNAPPCVITVEVRGALPEDSWTVDVTVRVAADVGL